MPSKYNTTYPFPDDIFDKIFNDISKPKIFSINLEEFDKLLQDILNLNLDAKPNLNNANQDNMLNKKPILPQYDSKYRVVKRTANNKTQYFVEFANPTKIGEPAYQVVPGKFTFDNLEEAKEQIAFFKKQTSVSEEIIYEE